MTTRTILRIDSSARRDDSVARRLVDQAVAQLADDDTEVVVRDLADGVPALTDEVITAMWTPADERSPAQHEVLRFADELIDELGRADVVVLGLSMYNFGPPAALKAWVDLVARRGETFRYTDDGFEGLLTDRPTYVIAASGGTPIDGPLDHATPWLRTVLGFLGISDIRVVAAGELQVDPEAALERARQAVAHSVVPTRAAA